MMGLLPLIYNTVRINFLGALPDTWGFNIASQLAWVNIMYEVVREALLLPLYFIIGKGFKTQSQTNKEMLENKINIGLLITITIFSIMSLIIYIFARPLVVNMEQDSQLIDATVSYIRLEVIAKVLFSAVQFYNVILILLGKDRYVYLYLSLQMLLSIILDILFVSSFDISLNLGVDGIAYCNIITNATLIIFMINILKKEGIHPFIIKKSLDNSWIRQWFKVGSYSGIESFVRNSAYILMVLKMVNMVGKSGTFWVANNFIWGWLLLPITQLGQLIKKDISEKNDEILNTLKGYINITTIIVLLWLVTMPLWSSFIKNIMNIEDYQEVYHLVKISIIFYILYAYNNIADSYFYGIGRTDFLLIQSLIVNTVEYGTLFILFRAGIYVPTLNTITLMFAAGIGIDSIITFIMLRVHLYKKYDKRLVNIVIA
jgi:Na+-driven multidrug efflux pump